MNELEEMQMRHEQEIQELRDKCQHSSISEWLEVDVVIGRGATIEVDIVIRIKETW